MRTVRLNCLILLCALLFTVSDACAGVVVILRRQAQSAGKYVRVADVARVDGADDRAREVAMTVLGPAPRRGEVREITRWDIESRLFEMGINADVSFSGNTQVVVYGNGAPMRPQPPLESVPFRQLADVPGASESMTAPSTRTGMTAVKPAAAPVRYDEYDGYGGESLSGEPSRRRRGDDILTEESKKRVGLEIANYFMERYKSAKTTREDIEVAAKVISADDRIPYSAYSLKVEDAEGRIPGGVSMRILVRDTDESPPREVAVTADAEVFGKALVAVRSIPRGESMMEDDVAVQRVKMESGKSYLPPNAVAVVGREARRAFKPGEIILADDAPVGDAVKRGHFVVMKTEGSGWGVQAKVKALGAGAVGDIITVEDMTNKTKYPARITGPGTVAVVVRHDPHGVVKKDI